MITTLRIIWGGMFVGLLMLSISYKEVTKRDYSLDLYRDSVTIYDEDGVKILTCPFDSLQTELINGNL